MTSRNCWRKKGRGGPVWKGGPEGEAGEWPGGESLSGMEYLKGKLEKGPEVRAGGRTCAGVEEKTGCRSLRNNLCRELQVERDCELEGERIGNGEWT